MVQACVSAFGTVPSEVLFSVFESKGTGTRPSIVYCGQNAKAKVAAYSKNEMPESGGQLVTQALGAGGNVNLNCEPLPISLLTEMSPPIARAISRLIARPRPVP